MKITKYNFFFFFFAFFEVSTNVEKNRTCFKVTLQRNPES